MRRANGTPPRKIHAVARWPGYNPGRQDSGASAMRPRNPTVRNGAPIHRRPARFRQRAACGKRAPGGGSGRVDGTLLRTFATCAAVTVAPVLPQLVRTKFDTSATS
ncbi:hypothetical protein DM39_3647 [Burkholderia cenocepacia]|uniref:Uncharacterized protein n=1 Tax=Burkholderia cenocepacia TaxID=95486 RepID=A0AAN0VPP6_9BURK|nr:hypothetical protein DM39_3647 [Burkholderia cenocepacia]